MPRERTEEASWWFDAVYSAIQEVPPGKVTSYGHIALLLGEPKRSRQVGVCLKHLPRHNDGERHRHHDANVPWQRVINSRGMISPRGPGSAQRQASALRRERVAVTRNAMGEHCIDLSVYGWFPRHLPSEQAPTESESEAEGNEGGNLADGETQGQGQGNAQAPAQPLPGEQEAEGNEGESSTGQGSSSATTSRRGNRNRSGNIHL